jgi:Asp-tRNA(Asn)/Glu-tRNA(Gln) amidotransferase A subunit family amidase
VTQAEAEAARARRDEYRELCARVLEGFDVLIAPTQPFVAPLAGQTGDDKLRDRMIRFTYPFDGLGWPALALPCGAAEDGLPASLQVVAPRGADALVLGTALSLERVITRTRES